MKKGVIIIIVILAALSVWGVGAYNSFIEKENNAIAAWQEVEALYKRRSDELPDMVNTAKIYATNKTEIYNKVIAARAVCAELKVNLDSITTEQVALYRAAQHELTLNVRDLVALKGEYEALDANQNFKDIESRLLTIKTQIAEAMQNFENEVQTYNQSLNKFPNKYIATLFKIKPIDYGNTAHQ